MKTVIYLDELLLTNFLAAAALLLGAGLLCARQCSGLRLMAGMFILCSGMMLYHSGFFILKNKWAQQMMRSFYKS